MYTFKLFITIPRFSLDKIHHGSTRPRIWLGHWRIRGEGRDARPLSPISFIFTARKRSLGQGDIFTPVCHSVHRGNDGILPGTMHTTPPPDHVPPHPRTMHPLLQCRACWETRSTRGRYTSYWNAILLFVVNEDPLIAICLSDQRYSVLHYSVYC